MSVMHTTILPARVHKCDDDERQTDHAMEKCVTIGGESLITHAGTLFKISFKSSSENY